MKSYNSRNALWQSIFFIWDNCCEKEAFTVSDDDVHSLYKMHPELQKHLRHERG